MSHPDTAPHHAFIGWVTELARAHSRSLAALARSEGLGVDDAPDAVQEAFHTFLQLPQARSLMEAPDDTRALLAVLVRNVARNMRRRHHRALPHAGTEAVAELADALPSVDELIATAEERARLVGCVRQLGEIQRRVVTLRMLEELSGAEVAAQLELQPGHVAVLLHRAKKELLSCLGLA